MIPRLALVMLVTAGILLPLVLAVVLGLARLLAAMQDTAAASVLDRIALAVSMLWGLDLIALLLALGIRALDQQDRL